MAVLGSVAVTSSQVFSGRRLPFPKKRKKNLLLLFLRHHTVTLSLSRRRVCLSVLDVSSPRRQTTTVPRETRRFFLSSSSSFFCFIQQFKNKGERKTTACKPSKHMHTMAIRHLLMIAMSTSRGKFDLKKGKNESADFFKS